MATVLVIGDTHEPFCLDGYLEHCVDVADTVGADEVVHVGDLIDLHALSFHDHDPSGMSAGDELILASKKVKRWVEAFPHAHHIFGNHDMLLERKLMRHGIPRAIMLDFADILKMPNRKKWKSHTELVFDNVFYRHGIGAAGIYGHRNAMLKMRQSVVQGHSHGVAGIEYSASCGDLIFGMATGCGIDASAYASAYGKHFVQKPIISCGVVFDGKDAALYPADLGSKYDWINHENPRNYVDVDEIVDKIEAEEYEKELARMEKDFRG